MRTIEEKREYKRLWAARKRVKDPESHRESARRYRLRHPDKIKAYSERIGPRLRERYATDREFAERARARAKEWRVANPERATANRQRTVANNPERDRQYKREWLKRNPEKRKIVHRLDVARRNRAQRNGTVTAAEWEQILLDYGNKCAYCGAEGVKLTMDHVVPLVSKVVCGLHVARNIVPACTPCNSKKNNKLLHVADFPKAA